MSWASCKRAETFQFVFIWFQFWPYRDTAKEKYFDTIRLYYRLLFNIISLYKSRPFLNNSIWNLSCLWLFPARSWFPRSRHMLNPWWRFLNSTEQSYVIEVYMLWLGFCITALSSSLAGWYCNFQLFIYLFFFWS